MKLTKKICLSFMLTLAAGSAFAQGEKEVAQAPEEKAWMAYMTPGKMHEMLAKSQGLWTEEVTMWMKPDAPPSKSTMTCMYKMIMGNRYLQGMNRGSFNNMPFEGISVTGYDNAKNVFVSSWIDNMGTGMMYMEGKWDEKDKSIVFTGTQIDPVSGMDMKVREIMTFKDDNNQMMEMYMTPEGGAEYKSLEIKSTRKITPQPLNPAGKPTPAPGTNSNKK
jgi:hypothetical protein